MTIGINYELEIEVVSPLHIGNGVKLRRGIDFASDGVRTFRLDERKVLDAHWPSDPVEQRQLIADAAPLAQLVPEHQLAAHSLYSYSVSVLNK
jgi:hypothetical protein